jgi:hypothetical protein
MSSKIEGVDLITVDITWPNILKPALDLHFSKSRQT